MQVVLVKLVDVQPSPPLDLPAGRPFGDCQLAAASV